MFFVKKQCEFAKSIIDSLSKVRKNEHAGVLEVPTLDVDDLLDYLVKLGNKSLLNGIYEITNLTYDLKCGDRTVLSCFNIFYGRGIIIFLLKMYNFTISTLGTFDRNNFSNALLNITNGDVPYMHHLEEINLTKEVERKKLVVGELYLTYEDVMINNAHKGHIYYVNEVAKRYFLSLFSNYGHHPVLRNMVFNTIDLVAYNHLSTNDRDYPARNYAIDEALFFNIWEDSDYVPLVKNFNYYIDKRILGKFLSYNSPDTINNIFTSFMNSDFKLLVSTLDEL